MTSVDLDKDAGGDPFMRGYADLILACVKGGLYNPTRSAARQASADTRIAEKLRHPLLDEDKRNAAIISAATML